MTPLPWDTRERPCGPHRHRAGAGLHRNTVTLLHQETAARIDIDAMDRLCASFKIPVGELIEFVPERSRSKKTLGRLLAIDAR